LRRVFGLGLGSEVGGVHRGHDAYAQQEPKNEMEFAYGAVGHGSGTLLLRSDPVFQTQANNDVWKAG
jgi:hypothetical protein